MLKKPMRLIIFVTVFSILFSSLAMAQDGDIRVFIDGKERIFSSSPVLINSKVYVPLRDIFEALGAKVHWEQSANEVIVTRKGVEIKFEVNSDTIYINKQLKKIDGGIYSANGRTLVPLRFVSETLGEKVGWNEKGKYVYIGNPPNASAVNNQNSLASETRNLNINGKSFKVNLVTLDLDTRMSLKVVSAKDQLGHVESLNNMAEMHGAIVAINGTYFNAYEDIKDSVGNIIINRRPVHLGNFGTTIGIADNKEIQFDEVRFEINGISDDGRKINWAAYAMNRTPSKEANAICAIYSRKGKPYQSTLGNIGSCRRWSYKGYTRWRCRNT